jgi:hypothetical protein
MRVRRTAVSLAGLGLVLGAATVLDTTVLAGTALAATTPAAGSAACTNGATRAGLGYGILQTCKNGVWVSTKCPTRAPEVRSYSGPPPSATCAPHGAY